MAYISTAAKKAQHERTDLDVYYENLEEAYGNLPVPSDDWAHIGKEFEKAGVEFDKEKLEDAIQVIQDHYDACAKVLGKAQKFN